MNLKKYNKLVKSTERITGISETDLYCMTAYEAKRRICIGQRLNKKARRAQKWENSND